MQSEPCGSNFDYKFPNTGTYEDRRNFAKLKRLFTEITV